MSSCAVTPLWLRSASALMVDAFCPEDLIAPCISLSILRIYFTNLICHRTFGWRHLKILLPLCSCVSDWPVGGEEGLHVVVMMV